MVHAASFHFRSELGMSFFQTCRVDVSLFGVAFGDSLSVRVVVDGPHELMVFCMLTAQMVVTEYLRRYAPHTGHQS
jgi:hypothetical protein